MTPKAHDSWESGAEDMSAHIQTLIDEGLEALRRLKVPFADLEFSDSPPREKRDLRSLLVRATGGGLTVQQTMYLEMVLRQYETLRDEVDYWDVNSSKTSNTLCESVTSAVDRSKKEILSPGSFEDTYEERYAVPHLLVKAVKRALFAADVMVDVEKLVSEKTVWEVTGPFRDALMDDPEWADLSPESRSKITAFLDEIAQDASEIREQMTPVTSQIKEASRKAVTDLVASLSPRTRGELVLEAQADEDYMTLRHLLVFFPPEERAALIRNAVKDASGGTEMLGTALESQHNMVWRPGRGILFEGNLLPCPLFLRLVRRFRADAEMDAAGVEFVYTDEEFMAHICNELKESPGRTLREIHRHWSHNSAEILMRLSRPMYGESQEDVEPWLNGLKKIGQILRSTARDDVSTPTIGWMFDLHRLARDIARDLKWKETQEGEGAEPSTKWIHGQLAFATRGIRSRGKLRKFLEDETNYDRRVEQFRRWIATAMSPMLYRRDQGVLEESTPIRDPLELHDPADLLDAGELRIDRDLTQAAIGYQVRSLKEYLAQPNTVDATVVKNITRPLRLLLSECPEEVDVGIPAEDMAEIMSRAGGSKEIWADAMDLIMSTPRQALADGE